FIHTKRAYVCWFADAGAGAASTGFVLWLLFLALLTGLGYRYISRNNMEYLDLQHVYMQTLLRLSQSSAAKDVRLSHHSVERQVMPFLADDGAERKSARDRSEATAGTDEKPGSGEKHEPADRRDTVWQISPVKRDQRIVITQQVPTWKGWLLTKWL